MRAPRAVILLGRVDWFDVIPPRARTWSERIELGDPWALCTNRRGDALYALRPSSAKPGRAPAAGEAADLFRAWHGHEPGAALQLQVDWTSAVRKLGRAACIGYEYVDPDGERRSELRYHHFGEEGAALPSLLGVGPDAYVVRGGGFQVTSRGIVG